MAGSREDSALNQFRIFSGPNHALPIGLPPKILKKRGKRLKKRTFHNSGLHRLWPLAIVEPHGKSIFCQDPLPSEILFAYLQRPRGLSAGISSRGEWFQSGFKVVSMSFCSPLFFLAPLINCGTPRRVYFCQDPRGGQRLHVLLGPGVGSAKGMALIRFQPHFAHSWGFILRISCFRTLPLDLQGCAF